MLINGEKNGKAEKFNDSGKLIEVCTYVNDKKNGKAKKFNDSGELIEVCTYVNDKKDGVCIVYDENKIEYKSLYIDDKLINNKGIYKIYDDKGNILQIHTIL
jgi:antitoxin component YwqK of YwqJK toxin-antitoxin module